MEKLKKNSCSHYLLIAIAGSHVTTSTAAARSLFEALQPAPRDVVLDRRRGGVRLWLSCKAFSHLVVFRPSRANPLGAAMNAVILVSPARIDECDADYRPSSVEAHSRQWD